MREALIHTYGLTENERDFIKSASPKHCTVSNDTKCFTDIVITDAIAVVIRPDMLTQADKELFFDIYNDTVTCEQTIIIVGTLDVPKYFNYPLTFFDTFDDFEKEFKSIILHSYRKRYLDICNAIDISLSILSCVRFRKGITVENLANELDMQKEQIKHYIEFLQAFGNWIYIDGDMIKLSTDQPFRWDRPNMCNTVFRKKDMIFNVGDIITVPVVPGGKWYPGVVSKISVEDDFTEINLICEHDGKLYTVYRYDGDIRDLNFYIKELTGNEKVLVPVSEYLKGNIDLPQFLEEYQKSA